MDNIQIFIGSTLIILASIGLLSNVAVLCTLVRQRRHSNLPLGNNKIKTSNDLSQYFLMSMWICFTTNLILSIGHDGPSVITDGPILGHTVAGVCGWFSRWVFYASVGHMMLLAFNRYTILTRGSVMKHKIFGTKIGLRFSTFIIWAPAATIATVIKLKVCEFQFVPASLAQICIETITDQYAVDVTTRLRYDDLKVLLIVDSSILSVVSLFLLICVWKIFWSLKKRQMRITQAASVLSMAEKVHKKQAENVRQNGKTVIMVKERDQVRQLVVFSFAFIAHALCYLLIYWKTKNEWIYFALTLIQIIYSGFCPLTYLWLTNDIRKWFPCLKHDLEVNVSETGSQFSWSVPTTSHGVSGGKYNEKSAFSDVYCSKTPSPIFSNMSHSDQLTFTSPMSLDVINLYQCQNRTKNVPVLFSNETGDRSHMYEKSLKRTSNNRMTIIQARADSIEPRRKSIDSSADNRKSGLNGIQSPFFKRPTKSRLPPVRLDSFKRQTSSGDSDRSPQVLSEIGKKRKSLFFNVASGSVDSSNGSVSHLRTIEELRKKRMQNSETLSLQNCENDGSLDERFLDNFTSLYPAKNSTFHTSLAALSESKCSSICSVEDTDRYEKLNLNSFEENIKSTSFPRFEDLDYSTL